MKVLSRLASVVSAFAILALAAPVTAQNVKYFDLSAPAGPIPASTQTVDITFKNIENGNSTFNSVAVAWTKTSGISLIVVTDAKSFPGNLGTYVELVGDEIAVTGLPPTKKNQSVTIRLQIQITASSCGGGTITWSGRAWTGSPSSPSSEFVQNNANPKTVVAGPTCTVEFERAPASALLVSGFAAISSVANVLPTSSTSVRAVVKNGTSVDESYTGPISIAMVTKPDQASIDGNAVAIATLGAAEFPLLSVNKTGAYSLRATAGTLAPSAAVSILVSYGTLDCDAGTNQADPSQTGVNWVVERLQHNEKFGCTAVNYVATSGGTDLTPKTDPYGFVLGTDFFSIVYDVAPDEGVLLTHVYTSSPYLMAEGQAPKKKVRYCPPGVGSCTNGNKANLVLTPGCLSGLPVVAAIPFLPSSSTERHPGCTRSFGWFSVEQDQCGIGTTGGCVRFQFELLEAKDPPWGMTDE